MDISTVLILGLAMGIIFGFVLEKSKVLEPEIILAQFQLRKFIMLKVFLTGIATGLVVYSYFFSFGFERLSWKTTIYLADIVGGAMLGTGIAIAGACPGTLFAQIGAGYRDAWAILMGGIVGTTTFIMLQPWLKTWLLSGAPHQKLTLDGVLDLPFYVVALGFVACIIIILVMLEKYKPWRDELNNN